MFNQNQTTKQITQSGVNRPYGLALMSILGILLSYMFVAVAALPMRYLRIAYGRKAFLLSSAVGLLVLLGVKAWYWAAIYFSLCLLIGFYRELEEKNYSIFLSSMITILTTAGTNLFLFFSYTKLTQQNMRTLIVEKMGPFYEQFKEVPRLQEINMEEILWFIPSGLIVGLMVVLFVSLTLTTGPGKPSPVTRGDLKAFRLPDWVIWPFLIGLATTLLDFKQPILEVVGCNLLLVCVAAYFFQGLAVFTYFLDRMGIFGFWRLLAYFLAFFQFFAFVSGLGILDFWFDFRTSHISKNRKIEI